MTRLCLGFSKKLDNLKLYEREGGGRYSPPECIGAVRERVGGDPDFEKICTSHVERSNLRNGSGLN